MSGNPEDFEPWPEMRSDRLLDMYPESELVRIYALPRYSAERAQSWEALGVRPEQQAQCERELDALIAKLTADNKSLTTNPTVTSPELNFNFIWGK